MLRLKTFGGLTLTGSDVPLVGACQQRKPLALLALLASATESGLTREKLLGMLWGESVEERARGNLKQTLYALRRDTGQPELMLGVSSLRLNPAVIEVDSSEFDMLATSGRNAEAVALYAGAYLDGVYVEDADEFERWAEEQRARLAATYLRSLDRLANDAEQQDDFVGAVRWLSVLMGARPLDAFVAMRLLAALDATGDRLGALRHGEAFCAIVRTETGSPAPSGFIDELARLQTAPISIRAHSPPPSARPSNDTAWPERHATKPAERFSARRLRPVRPRTVLALLGALLLLGVAGLAFVHDPFLRPIDSFLRRDDNLPLTSVPEFALRAGPDSLAFVGSILADRVSQSLRATNVARLMETDSSSRGTSTKDADLTVSGYFYLVGDTVVVEADVLGQDPLLSLASIPTSRTPIGGLNFAADSITANVTRTVATLFDSSRAAFGIAPDMRVTSRAYSWFITGMYAASYRLDCDRGYRYLDSALTYDPSFSLALVDKLRCATIGQFGPVDSARMASVTSDIERRRSRLSPLEAALAEYLSLQQTYDPARTLVAARKLRAIAPELRGSMGFLVDALMEARRFEEVIQIYENANDVGTVGDTGYPWKGLPWWAYLDALHLTGQYTKELQALTALRKNKILDRYGLLNTFVIRALAGTRDSIGLTKALAQATRWERAHPFVPPQRFTFAEELTIHGFPNLGKTLTARDRAKSCADLGLKEDPLIPGVPPEAGRRRVAALRDPNTPEEVREAQRTQLRSAASALRYGCVDDASHELVDFRGAPQDSLELQAVRGEILARRGNTLAALDASEWLSRHEPPHARWARLPPWASTYPRARIAAILGRRSEAMRLLSAALNQGMPYDVSTHSDPLWSGFNEDPGFKTAISH